MAKNNDMYWEKWEKLLEAASNFQCLFPDSVLIVGAVYNPEAISFKAGKPVDYYINLVGGPKRNAETDDIYVIKADGQVRSKATGYGEIDRGDIIVVPEKM